MLRLDELDEKVIDFYFEEIKEKVLNKIKECKSILEGDQKIIEKVAILEVINNIEKNLKDYLIGEDLKKLIKEYSEEFLEIEIEIPFEKVVIIPLKLKKNELLEKYNTICSSYFREELTINLERTKIEKKVKDLNEKLKILKNIFAHKAKKDKGKLKYKHFFKYIFDYDNILNNKEENEIVSLRHTVLSKLNVKTCPYCGRQYITNYNESYSTADLDHFYSQSKYPYLALNIYNFIPACAVCNRNFKNDKEVKINPRIEEFGENAVFILGNEISTYMDMELKDIDIKLDIRTSGILEELIKKDIDTFKLEEVYKVHNDYVLQMIKDITFRGNESYLESIKMLFEKDDENEVLKKLKELIKAPYEFKIRENEPLGKLTKDILNEIEKKLEKNKFKR